MTSGYDFDHGVDQRAAFSSQRILALQFYSETLQVHHLGKKYSGGDQLYDHPMVLYGFYSFFSAK